MIRDAVYWETLKMDLAEFDAAKRALHRSVKNTDRFREALSKLVFTYGYSVAELKRHLKMWEGANHG